MNISSDLWKKLRDGGFAYWNERHLRFAEVIKGAL